ncbi:MAG: hypothetical protein GX601_16895, partial [Anaerolineales bacterium]|nr:hypothetical protein [Anaerolineales bacterium]
AAVTLNGGVLVTGGYNGTSYLNSAQLYDPAANSWSAASSMGQTRADHTVTRLPDGSVLVAGGVSSSGYLSSTEVLGVSSPWAFVGAMANRRANHTATLLPDGRVLVVGGYNGTTRVAEAEIYNPATQTWSSAGSLNQARDRHTATLLLDGRVLVVGGWQFGQLQTSEIYDPSVPAWASLTAMSTQRARHAATLLADGRVLVAGGVNNTGTYQNSGAVYNPSNGTWTATGAMSDHRTNHTLTLLPDNTVLVVGGRDALDSRPSTQIFRANTLMWYSQGDLNAPRHDHTATLLPNGRVLAAGGTYVDSGLPVPSYRSSAEVYDPATGLWSNTGSMSQARTRHTATLLPDGHVLVAGGYRGGTPTNFYSPYVSSVEIYSPATGTFTSTAGMSTGRADHTATLLPDGRVLVVGGRTKLPMTTATSYVTRCETYNPATSTWTEVAGLPLARADHTATLLPDGRVLIAGGRNSDGVFSPALVYDPVTNTWVTVASLGGARYDHTATLLLDGRVFVAGGESANVLATTEAYDRGLGYDQAWQPQVSTMTYPVRLGFPLDATGTGFCGVSEASGGNANQASSSGYPLVQLRRIDNEQIVWLPPSSNGFSATSFTSTPVTAPHAGPALLTVFTNGIPSTSRMTLVRWAATYTPLILVQ